MDLKRKLEIVDTAIESIAAHEDEDASVRLAALEEVGKILQAQRVKIGASIKSRVEGLFGEQKA